MTKNSAMLFFLVFLFSCNSTEEKESVHSKQPKVLPKIIIYDNKQLDFDTKKPCTITYVNSKGDTVFKKLDSKARYRGGFSVKYYKHSLSFSLSKKHKLAGMKKDDDWIINASYNDKTFMRHKLSYDLFRSFSKENIAPKCKYVEFFINDQYQGLYVLMERMDAKRLKLDKTAAKACVFKDPYVFRIDTSRAHFHGLEKGNLFFQKYPDLKVNNLNPDLDTLRRFIYEADGATFEKEIASFIDFNNLIDWHILVLITNNGDGLVKNFYLYRDRTNAPFKFAPWDYDSTFGQDGDSEKNEARKVDFMVNGLLKRLLESNALDYKGMLKKRYSELKELGKFSPEIIEKMVEKNYLKIQPYLQKNLALWPLESEFYHDSFSTEQELEYMKGWIKNHQKYCDSYINSL